MPQGTVKSFDEDSGTVVLLDDSLRQLTVDRDVFTASGLLHLRIGQRVRFELIERDGEERVTNLNLVSL